MKDYSSPTDFGTTKKSLLLVTHVVIRQGPNGAQIDDQTAAGIAQWCKFFDTVTYIGIEESGATKTSSSATWIDIENYAGAGRCTVIALPNAYRLLHMLRKYRSVRTTLRNAIARHTNLCFTVGGIVGDWPAIGALESISQGRRFAVWIDRVETSVIRNKIKEGASVWKRMAAIFLLPMMELYTQHLLKASSVALLQGQDTYEYYQRWASAPHCTYDTHTHVDDEISSEFLALKRKRIMAGVALNILYVGRAASMKGPMDWLRVMKTLKQLCVPFNATWIGDGPELERMRAFVVSEQLDVMVQLPGFVSDRNLLLQHLRKSDLLVFCHKTPESPRTLIEALVCGAAIIGYESSYPIGLVAKSGGGIFSAQDDVNALACHIANLNADRRALARLISSAAESGRLYNEDTVYAHRALLMQRT